PVMTMVRPCGMPGWRLTELFIKSPCNRLYGGILEPLFLNDIHAYVARVKLMGWMPNHKFQAWSDIKITCLVYWLGRSKSSTIIRAATRGTARPPVSGAGATL
ncbi:MAG: hypothetical protein VW935_09355, partial [Novosphingobium sp.]